jgi:hypothetical protein
LVRAVQNGSGAMTISTDYPSETREWPQKLVPWRTTMSGDWSARLDVTPSPGSVEVTSPVARKSAHWQRVHSVLDAELAERLRRALDAGTEGHRACEAAFALVLARQLSTDEVAFGVQCHAADGAMIPAFVQRASCDDRFTVNELIARLGRVARTACPVTDGFAEMDVPVLTVEPHRDERTSSLANAPNAPRHAPASAWLQVTLSLVGEPQLLAVYDADRCVSGRAEPLLASFQHTLAEVLREPVRRWAACACFPSPRRRAS